MPKIDVSHKDLCSLIGRKLSIEQLSDEILYAKGEIDEVNGDSLKVDIKDTNRPDLWSTEGVAREIRAHQRKSGLPKYDVKSSNFVVNVDSKVNGIRPYTVCAVVKGLKINETILTQLVQLQEKVAGTFGRNRKEIAIGVYDLGKIRFPIKYTTTKPNEISFVPLDFKDKMSPKEILEIHAKGKEFGHLLHGKSEYPIFIDAANEVLSMPPIINSNHTGKVTEKTSSIFIECSGFDMKFLNTALNVVVASLHERGGVIHSVKVNYGKKTCTTPDLQPKKFYTALNYINSVIGLQLEEKKIIELAEKSLYKAKVVGRKLELLYPAYRQDIMHERDIVEDIAISYGFNSIEPLTPGIITKGNISKTQTYSDHVAEIMTGSGFQEVLSYTLTNSDNLLRKMNIEGNVVEIEKPMSSNWSVFRTSLLPGLMEFLTKNKHVEYPQNLFEIGNIVLEDHSAPTRTKDLTKLAVVVSASIVNYEQVSSVLDALFRSLGVEYKLKRSTHTSFIEGRTAEIFIGKDSIGFIGEIHPSVLNNWELETPVVAFEISLKEIFEILEKK